MKSEQPAKMIFTPDTPGVRGEEFQDWLRKYGVDPSNCARLELQGNQGVATLYKRNDDGKRYVDPADRTRAATYEFEFPINEPPPRSEHGSQ